MHPPLIDSLRLYVNGTVHGNSSARPTAEAGAGLILELGKLSNGIAWLHVQLILLDDDDDDDDGESVAYAMHTWLVTQQLLGAFTRWN